MGLKRCKTLFWWRKAFQDANSGVQSWSEFPTWRSKAPPRPTNGAPKQFGEVKNQRKSGVFPWFLMFFKLLEDCIGTCFPTGSGDPKGSHGLQLGGRNLPKDPNLEAQSVPKTSSWRSEALQRTELGGSESFQDPKLEAHSAPRP